MTTAIGQTQRASVDRTLLLVVPAAAFMLLLFVYPFLYGLVLSFNPNSHAYLAPLKGITAVSALTTGTLSWNVDRWELS